MERDGQGEVAWWLLLAAVAAAASITAMQTAVALAGLAWAARLVVGPHRHRLRPDPVLTALLGGLAGWSLVSAWAAPLREVALRATASSLMWVVAPLATALLTPPRRRIVRSLLLAQAGLLGGWAVLEWGLWWDGDLLHRVRGPYSHHMTLAGVLLIGVLQGLPWPRLDPLVRGAPGIWLGRLAALLGVAGLAATLTRSALLGLVAGAAALHVLKPGAGRRHRLLGTAALLLLAATAVAAPAVREMGQARALSAGAASVADRAALWRAGAGMIRERPLLGIGANGTQRHAHRFLPEDHRRPGAPSHLHSASLTLAAERGLPALALAALLYGASLRRFWRQAPPSGRGALRGAAAAVVGFLVMGLFENNFDDSEVLFVHLVTLSAAWTGGGAGDGGGDPASPGRGRGG